MRGRKKDTILFSLIAIIVLLGVGYAYLTTDLNILGTANVTRATWDIHLENIQVQSGSITPTIAATVSSDRLTVTYAVTLSVPGDYYEFTVDAKNAGTIDGMISSIVSKLNGSVITTLPDYLEYYVRYANGNDIETNHLIPAGGKETYRVHIGYKADLDASQLPSANQGLNLEIITNYVQSTPDTPPRYDYIYSNYGTSDGTIPAGVPTYTNYRDEVAAHGYPFFLRFSMNNNVIVEAHLGFLYNGNDYYIKGGDSTSYNANKAIMQQAFGTSNCTETTENGLALYYCYANGLTVRNYDNGFVSAVADNMNGWYCSIAQVDYSVCYND